MNTYYGQNKVFIFETVETKKEGKDLKIFH